MSKKYAYNPDYAPKCEHNQNAVAGCVSAEIFMACLKERDELYVKLEKKYKKKIKWLKYSHEVEYCSVDSKTKNIMSPKELELYVGETKL